MENSTDALIMAFAVLVFVGALSLLFYQITIAKDTADLVFLYRDRTNFYTYEDNSTSGEKEVTKDIVISTLHKWAKERDGSYAIIVNYKNGDSIEYDLSKITFASGSSKEEKMNELVDEFIINNTAERFTEKNVKVTTSGKFLNEDDGTQVTLIPGGTKMIIIYTEI